MTDILDELEDAAAEIDRCEKAYLQQLLRRARDSIKSLRKEWIKQAAQDGAEVALLRQRLDKLKTKGTDHD